MQLCQFLETFGHRLVGCLEDTIYQPCSCTKSLEQLVATEKLSRLEDIPDSEGRDSVCFLQIGACVGHLSLQYQLLYYRVDFG